MEKAVTALFNQLLLLFSIMQGINAEPLTFLPFLAWIDGFFVLFEIWLIMKNMYIFPFKSDEKNCIMDL